MRDLPELYRDSFKDPLLDLFDRKEVREVNLVKNGVLSPLVTFTRASSAGVWENNTYTIKSTNVARFGSFDLDIDYDGIVLEPARTNGVRNSTMTGAAAGTPGTLPTGWSESLTGLTREVVAKGTVNGLDYIDVRFSGTATAGTLILDTGAITNIVASSGQIWSGSAYISLVGGNLSNISAATITITSFNSGSVALNNYNADILNINSSLARKYIVSPGLDATTAYAQLKFRFTCDAAAIDFTVRIAAPQLEFGTYPSTFIQTTSAGVTRAVDICTADASQSWFNQLEGTIFAKFKRPASSTGVFTAVFNINKGATTDAIRGLIGNGANSNVTNEIVSNNSTVFGVTNSLALAGAARISALAYKENDSASSTNGSVPTTDTSCALPTNLTTFNIGGVLAGSGANFGGAIQELIYYPKRISNAELTAMTAINVLDFVPKFFTDPTRYLENYSMSGSNIASAGDLSDSNIPAIQATPANQPTIDTAGINSKPAIKLVGASSQYLTADAVSAFITGDDRPACVFIVFRKNTNDTMVPWSFSNSGNTNPLMWNVHNTDTSSTIFRRATSGYGLHTSSITTTTNTNYVQCFNFAGTTYDYYTNTTLVSGALNLNAIVVNQFSIGVVTRNAPGSFFNGFIGDVIVFDRYLTAEERILIMEYLGYKWGVTVA